MIHSPRIHLCLASRVAREPRGAPTNTSQTPRISSSLPPAYPMQASSSLQNLRKEGHWPIRREWARAESLMWTGLLRSLSLTHFHLGPGNLAPFHHHHHHPLQHPHWLCFSFPHRRDLGRGLEGMKISPISPSSETALWDHKGPEAVCLVVGSVVLFLFLR